MSLRSLARSIVFTAMAGAIGLAAAGCSDAGTSTSNDEENSLKRPPQYVLLAFDGSLNLDFWNESRQFAKDNNLKFTYFISGPYFLASSKKAAYHGPRHAAGASDIGFGGMADAIKLRLEQVRIANTEGNEIASHACGHFDGSAWNASEWASEFDQFNDLIFNAGGKNGFTQPDLGIGPKDVIGFRAPLLGQGPGLYKTLSERHFVYDTSKTAAMNYWPEKQSGIWNFPLAQVKIVGSGKNTLSMDYNFYYAQSKGQPDPGNKDLYKKQMLDTYMQYFQTNYFGNRAPVHIGHHFSKWNGGAYWEAMQTFAKRVCGQPEVKCVTYRELAAFMDANAANIPAYKAGNFPKMPRPPGVEKPADVPPAVPDDQLGNNGFVGDVSEAHEEGE